MVASPNALLAGVAGPPVAVGMRGYAREEAQAPTSLPSGYSNDGLPPNVLEPEPEQPFDLQVYDSNLLATLIQDFEDAEQASRDNRLKAERDVDYYDNKQFTADIIAELERRGQPAIMLNRIRRKIKFMMGLEQAQRTKPQGLPRNPSDEDDAHAATDALRSICDMSKFDQMRSKAWKDMISAGWGGVEIVAEESPSRRNPRITIRLTRWDRMFFDPYSTEEDFSDANYLGVVIWMDKADAVRRYGDAAAEVFDVTIGESGNTYDDKPKETSWVHRQARPRIRVVQMYFIHTDGQWHFAEFTKGGFLRAGVSPWLDEDSEPEHPYSWRAANVDRDNNRYGSIREMVDVQDMLNKLVSKYLHLASVRQTFGTEGSLGRTTTRQLRQQLAKPDGHVGLAPGKKFGEDFGIIPTGDMGNANLQLLNAMMHEMDLIGANAAMEGESGAAASGKSVLAQQQGGQIETGPEMDTLRDMDRETYHKAWRRVRQFWTAEEWIRVTDDQKNIKFVGLNLPATQPVIDPMSGQQIVNPQTGQPQTQPVIDPLTGQPVIAKGDVSKLDLDIIIDDAPMVSGTMMDEQFKGLVGLAQVGIKFAPQVYIAASNLRNKGELMQMQAEQEQKPPDPIAQGMAQATIADKQASATSKQADAVHKIAQAKHLSVVTSGAQIGVAKSAAELQQDAERHAVEVAHQQARTAHEHIRAVGSAGDVRRASLLALAQQQQPPAAPPVGMDGQPQAADRPAPGGPPVRAPDGYFYVHAPHARGTYQRVVA